MLTVELVNGDKALNNPHELLSSGALVWLETIIAFTFAYWEIDQAAQRRALIAPQNTSPSVPGAHEPGARAPRLATAVLDYLYLGLTNATGFSRST